MKGSCGLCIFWPSKLHSDLPIKYYVGYFLFTFFFFVVNFYIFFFSADGPRTLGEVIAGTSRPQASLKASNGDLYFIIIRFCV